MDVLAKSKAETEAFQKHKELERKRDQSAEAEEHHWVESYDPEHHAFYYYCTWTEEMTWDKPANYVMAADDELMSAAIKIQCAWRARMARVKRIRRALKGNMFDAHHDKAEEAIRKHKELEQGRGADGHHWVESYDPEHNAFYYYCSWTEEMTWDKPASYIMAADDELMSAALKIQCAWRARMARVKKTQRALRGNMFDAHHDKAEEAIRKHKELEQGRGADGHHWVESYDPEQHAFYYYCSWTEEMTWDKPASYIMAADDELMSAAIKIQCAWRSKVARRGIAKRALGGKMHDHHREHDEALEAAKCKHRELEKQRDQSAEAQEHHWVESYDPHRETYYFYCTWTHETTWDKPANYVMAADDELMSAAIKIQCAWRARVARMKVKFAMNGKLHVLDKDTKKELYAHMRKQKGAHETMLADAAQYGQGHWVECFDPTSHKYYYHDTMTGETTWDKPANYVMAADDELMMAAIKIQCCWRARQARKDAMVRKVAEQSFSAADMRTKHLHGLSGDELALKVQKAQASAEAIRAKAGEAAGDWVSCYDDKSHSYYYYNNKTKGTTHVKPEHFIESADDETMAAVIKIQSAWRQKMSRRKAKQALEGKAGKVKDGEVEEMLLAHRQVAMEAARNCEWASSYDPTHDAYYYYHKHTHEVRWEEPEGFVEECDEEMLRAAITLQCAWRGKISRRKRAEIQYRMQHDDWYPEEIAAINARGRQDETESDDDWDGDDELQQHAKKRSKVSLNQSQVAAYSKGLPKDKQWYDNEEGFVHAPLAAKAVREYEQMLQGQPDHKEALMCLGMMAYHGKRWAKCVSFMQRATILRGTCPAKTLGHQELCTKDADYLPPRFMARAQYKLATECRFDNRVVVLRCHRAFQDACLHRENMAHPIFLMELSRVQEFCGDTRSALLTLAHIIKVFSGKFVHVTTVIMRAAVLLKHVEDYRQALSYFNYLLAIAPAPYTDFDLELQLGSCNQLLGRQQLAAQHYEELLKKMKMHRRVPATTPGWQQWLTSPLVFDNFGSHYMALDDYLLAADMFKTGLNLSAQDHKSDDDELREAYGARWMQLGECYFRSGCEEQAHHAAECALSLACWDQEYRSLFLKWSPIRAKFVIDEQDAAVLKIQMCWRTNKAGREFRIYYAKSKARSANVAAFTKRMAGKSVAVLFVGWAVFARKNLKVRKRMKRFEWMGKLKDSSFHAWAAVVFAERRAREDSASRIQYAWFCYNARCVLTELKNAKSRQSSAVYQSLQKHNDRSLRAVFGEWKRVALKKRGIASRFAYATDSAILQHTFLKLVHYMEAGILEKELAAFTLQALYHGWKDRQRVKEMLKTKRSENSYSSYRQAYKTSAGDRAQQVKVWQKAQGAVCIQSRVRGVLSRAETKRRVARADDAEKIRASAQKASTQGNAKSRIQRRMMQREKAARELAKKQRQSATVIQARVRGVHARRFVRRAFAAIKIQKVTRGQLQRYLIRPVIRRALMAHGHRLPEDTILADYDRWLVRKRLASGRAPNGLRAQPDSDEVYSAEGLVAGGNATERLLREQLGQYVDLRRTRRDAKKSAKVLAVATKCKPARRPPASLKMPFLEETEEGEGASDAALATSFSGEATTSTYYLQEIGESENGSTSTRPKSGNSRRTRGAKVQRDKRLHQWPHTCESQEIETLELLQRQLQTAAGGEKAGGTLKSDGLSPLKAGRGRGSAPSQSEMRLSPKQRALTCGNSSALFATYGTLRQPDHQLLATPRHNRWEETARAAKRSGLLRAVAHQSQRITEQISQARDKKQKSSPSRLKQEEAYREMQMQERMRAMQAALLS
jgi:hypothetical protein